MDGFERRTQAKQQSILEAARALFFAKGPASTTIADIASSAGVSPVTIYNYFTNKDTLVEIVIRDHLESSLARAEAVLDLEVPFKEKVDRFFALGDDETAQISDESLAGFDWHDEKIQAIYERFIAERQLPFLRRFIDMGKAEGAIKNELSTEAIMAFFGANMVIYRDKNLLKKGKTYLSSLKHLFFYGLLGK